MTTLSPHLFVDISSHGLGHLAQTAPVLQRLAGIVDGLRLTIRSGLPEWRLRQRIRLPFDHIAAASDCGYVMIDALTIDLAATAAAYRAAHADFATRVAAEARALAALRADAVFSDVAYLPLAGAARAGIPAMAMCSINWADMFRHYFGGEPWAAPIHADMLAAYGAARFLCLTPGMPMPTLDNIAIVGPVAALGRERRAELRATLGVTEGNSLKGSCPRGTGDPVRVVIVAFGGIPTRLPVERWATLPDTHWLVPAAWQVKCANVSDIETLDWPFTDILRSADALLGKPGYGTTAEAACNGTPLLYRRSKDWPEQDWLTEWLRGHGRCAEVSAEELETGDLAAPLDAVLRAGAPPVPAPDGIDQAAMHIAAMLRQVRPVPTPS